MKKLYETTVDIHGGREGKAVSRDGRFKVELRAPPELGGPKDVEATNPEQLFAAGYGACFGSALGVVARKKHVDVSKASLVSTVHLLSTDAGGYQLSVRLDVKIPGVPQDVAQTLMNEAHEICPYSQATRGNIEVQITASGE